MARYTGPMTKKSRRLGVDLVGGDAAFERRPYPPGQHGRGRIKESEYLLQLREKQKARFTYGVLEKQFHHYYDEASRRPARPVTTCCSCSSAASTTWSTAPASPAPVATPASWSCTVTSRSTAARSTSRRTRSPPTT